VQGLRPVVGPPGVQPALPLLLLEATPLLPETVPLLLEALPLLLLPAPPLQVPRSQLRPLQHTAVAEQACPRVPHALPLLLLLPLALLPLLELLLVVPFEPPLLLLLVPNESSSTGWKTNERPQPVARASAAPESSVHFKARAGMGASGPLLGASL